MWSESAACSRPSTAHRSRLNGSKRPLEDYLRTLPPGMPPLHQMLALEQRFFLADHNLLYTDKMSMAAGVEVRVPFLDNDLVRLANALPAHVKQRGRHGKWVLKKAIERHLPVRDRPSPEDRLRRAAAPVAAARSAGTRRRHALQCHRASSRSLRSRCRRHADCR